MSNWVTMLLDIIPTFIEWVKWIIEMKDDEWESISQAWPAPTRTRLARLRYEAKRDAKFGGGQ